MTSSWRHQGGSKLKSWQKIDFFAFLQLFFKKSLLRLWLDFFNFLNGFWKMKFSAKQLIRLVFSILGGKVPEIAIQSFRIDKLQLFLWVWYRPKILRNARKDTKFYAKKVSRWSECPSVRNCPHRRGNAQKRPFFDHIVPLNDANT